MPIEFLPQFVGLDAISVGSPLEVIAIAVIAAVAVVFFVVYHMKIMKNNKQK